MRAPRVAIIVDSGTTVPLRFDDPEFVRAIEDDDATTEGRGTLAQVLEAKKAGDVDLSPYVEDGWVLHVRPSIRIDERGAQYNAGQKAGGGVDIKEALRSQWGSWVMSVSLAEDLELTPKMAAQIKALCNPNRKAREDAFGDLPSETASILIARLRVHIDGITRPADRDPGQTSPKAQAGAYPPATGSNFSGDQSQSYAVDR